MIRIVSIPLSCFFQYFHDKTPAKPKVNVTSLIPNNIDIVVSINTFIYFSLRDKPSVYTPEIYEYKKEVVSKHSGITNSKPKKVTQYKMSK